jgi:hypothetical protein
MNIEEHLYDVTRRRSYINIADPLFESVSRSKYNIVSDNVWCDIEIHVSDVVWVELYARITDSLFDYEY